MFIAKETISSSIDTKHPTITGTRPLINWVVTCTVLRRSEGVKLRDSPVPPRTHMAWTPWESWYSSSYSKMWSSRLRLLVKGVNMEVMTPCNGTISFLSSIFWWFKSRGNVDIGLMEHNSCHEMEQCSTTLDWLVRLLPSSDIESPNSGVGSEE